MTLARTASLTPGVCLTHRRPRVGFTLLEVLVALSLSLLLVAAITTGLGMYWRFSTTGQKEVERAQLARAILRSIERDLRSVVYREPITSGGGSGQSQSQSGITGSSGSSGGTGSGTGTNQSGGSSSSSNSSGSSASSGTSASVTNVSSTSGSNQLSGSGAATTTPQAGLFGNAATLLIHVNRPSLAAQYVPVGAQQSVDARTSDMLTVAYFLADNNTSAIQSAVAGQGLARLEGDRLTLSIADQQSNLAAFTSRTEIIAPEVSALQFSYFDGYNWRFDWDSSVMGGLPKAVGIQLTIKLAATATTTGQKLAADEAGQLFELVVPLPLARLIDTSAIP